MFAVKRRCANPLQAVYAHLKFQQPFTHLPQNKTSKQALHRSVKNITLEDFLTFMAMMAAGQNKDKCGVQFAVAVPNMSKQGIRSATLAEAAFKNAHLGNNARWGPH